MKDLPRLFLAVAVGLLFSVLIDAASGAMFSPIRLHRIGPWYEPAVFGGLLASQLVVPGFIAGWLSKRRGWLIGSLVGALGALLVTILSSGIPATGPLASVVISTTVRSTIVGMIAGIAGSAIRNQRPNNSFKPTPLRGAA